MKHWLKQRQYNLDSGTLWDPHDPQQINKDQSIFVHCPCLPLLTMSLSTARLYLC